MRNFEEIYISNQNCDEAICKMYLTQVTCSVLTAEYRQEANTIYDGNLMHFYKEFPVGSPFAKTSWK